MSRMVNCIALKREAEGLDRVPYPGDLGKRIFDNVSKEAWGLWLKHSTMVINEYRLNPSQPEGRVVLRKQIEEFFFGEGAQLPPDYVPPAS